MAIRLGPCPCQPDSNGVGLRECGGERAKVAEQLGVCQEFKVGRAGFQPVEGSAVSIGQERDGACSATFNPQKFFARSIGINDHRQKVLISSKVRINIAVERT